MYADDEEFSILTWYLFIYLLRYLDQKTAKDPFGLPSQAATC